MKLMKFLVVALVAGGVCAPVASQADDHWYWDEKLDTLYLECTPDFHDPATGPRPMTLWFKIWGVGSPDDPPGKVEEINVLRVRLAGFDIFEY